MVLAKPGETCWRSARADRVRLLVDGRDYFAALRTALLAARRSIHILGWGFDPRVKLSPEEGEPEVGRLLLELVGQRPELDVRVLVWRSALPISATQGFFPHRAQAWFRGSGVDFRLDDTVPFGACHHQKIITIDGALAFVGGADLMPGRWDRPEHAGRDPERGPHPPRHELMAMVDGPAAAAFEDLFRDRWRGAEGESIAASGETATPNTAGLWPDGFAPDVLNHEVAIGRTVPAWREQGEVQEIAAMTLEAIFAARRLIYLENQYFTWPLAVEALATRLAEPAGPEVVLIVSEKSPSYFDRITMDRARSNALWRLKACDVFGRFHALAPHAADGTPIVVHAKAMIVDDTLLRVGSANLNNRSHGFDTECELVLEAQSAADRAAIATLRGRLLAHWLGRAEEAADLASAIPLAAAIWALDTGARLRPLAARHLGLVGEFIADFHLGDPADPGDSWSLGLRRRKLLDEARALRVAGTRPPRLNRS